MNQPLMFIQFGPIWLIFRGKNNSSTRGKNNSSTRYKIRETKMLLEIRSKSSKNNL